MAILELSQIWLLGNTWCNRSASKLVLFLQVLLDRPVLENAVNMEALTLLLTQPEDYNNIIHHCVTASLNTAGTSTIFSWLSPTFWQHSATYGSCHPPSVTNLVAAVIHLTPVSRLLPFFFSHLSFTSAQLDISGHVTAVIQLSTTSCHSNSDICHSPPDTCHSPPNSCHPPPDTCLLPLTLVTHLLTYVTQPWHLSPTSWHVSLTPW